MPVRSLKGEVGSCGVTSRNLERFDKLSVNLLKDNLTNLMGPHVGNWNILNNVITFS